MSWTTISSLATGVGTLVLAIATFASVRSANRAARVAEQALLVGTRPLLVPSRLDDPQQKIIFQEGQPWRLQGGRALAEVENGVVYLAISVRNAGRGTAVIRGWHLAVGPLLDPARPDPGEFRPQSRDLLVAPDDIGFWQGAFRDATDPQYDETVAAVKGGATLNIDVLYGDNDGGQRMISRMRLEQIDWHEEGKPTWIVAVVRHWNLDRPDPR
jgi:hypothetical protein